MQLRSSRLRLDMEHPADGHRLFAGVLVSSGCTHLSAALITAQGRGMTGKIRVAGALTTEAPREVSPLFSRLLYDVSPPAESLALLRAQLADTQASLVADLVRRSGADEEEILAVGVHDPGFWMLQGSQARGYLGLCDSARLAESTGLSVIDAFPARDLALGGLGGPIDAMAQWTLLRDSVRSRVLLDLGRTVRMTYLPATATDHADSRVLSFEVGPGTLLLDLLAERLTSGGRRLDPGGRLAVQGRRIQQLVDHWLTDPYFDNPLPRWHPHGVRPERFLSDSLQMAVHSGWSVQDLLCTATHFIAEVIGRTLCRRLPDDARIDEIVLTGGGQQNGLLLREIARTTQLPLIHASQLDVPEQALGPAAIAVLAMFHLDQIPGNPTAITKTEAPRPLGRLTPGSHNNWQQLIQTVVATVPQLRPLRNAS